MNETTPDHLTPATAANRLGVQLRTLSYWRAQGTGPAFVRLGHKTVRYPADGLARWLAERNGAAAPARATP